MCVLITLALLLLSLLFQTLEYLLSSLSVALPLFLLLELFFLFRGAPECASTVEEYEEEEYGSPHTGDCAFKVGGSEEGVEEAFSAGVGEEDEQRCHPDEVEVTFILETASASGSGGEWEEEGDEEEKEGGEDFDAGEAGEEAFSEE